MVNAVQSAKALLPIRSNDSGRSIDGRLLHFLKDSFPSSTTLDGMGTWINDVHPKKQNSGIRSNVGGNSNDGRLVQKWNDLSSSSITEGGIETWINAVQPSKHLCGIRSNVGGNIADDNSVHKLKALVRISTTVPVVDGSKTTLVIEGQSLKHHPPTDSPLLGMINSPSRLSHSSQRLLLPIG